MLYSESIDRLSRLAGANDQQNRMLAVQATSALIAGLAGNGRSVKPDSVDHNPEDLRQTQAIWYGSNFTVGPNLSELFNRVNFMMLQDNVKPGFGGLGLSRDSTQPHDHIVFVYNPPNEHLKSCGGSYAVFCERSAAALCDWQKNSLVHEYTHAIDALRLKDPTHMDDTPYDSNKMLHDVNEYNKYINDPIESNAMLQAAIESVDLQLHGGSNVAMPQSAHALSKLVMAEVMKGRGNAQLTPDTWRRFMKRIYQYWDDLNAIR